jgi:hypothetical protein
MRHPIDVIRKVLLTLIVIVLMLAAIGYFTATDELLFYAEILFYVIVTIASLPLLMLVCIPDKNR